MCFVGPRWNHGIFHRKIWIYLQTQQHVRAYIYTLIVLDVLATSSSLNEWTCGWKGEATCGTFQCVWTSAVCAVLLADKRLFGEPRQFEVLFSGAERRCSKKLIVAPGITTSI